MYLNDIYADNIRSLTRHSRAPGQYSATKSYDNRKRNQNQNCSPACDLQTTFSPLEKNDRKDTFAEFKLYECKMQREKKLLTTHPSSTKIRFPQTSFLDETSKRITTLAAGPCDPRPVREANARANTIAWKFYDPSPSIRNTIIPGRYTSVLTRCYLKLATKPQHDVGPHQRRFITWNFVRRDITSEVTISSECVKAEFTQMCRESRQSFRNRT
ncbi:hypothetical protein EVAR_80648_1 [Eumeta japonica]|uniref:Uncharacterized protein n=1 Tax=Eumeta variegata TaxID=151549 RepID=A0A4C1YR66_EUMVA|nr:hypothetical protein EVAR_80648_1 [Eumeta japonica]